MKQNKHHTGLTGAQVFENRKLYGSNALTPPPQESVWKMLFEKFEDPLIIVLLVAMTLSFVASCYEFFNDGEAVVFFEPLGILIAVLLSTGVGFLFELSAKRKFDVLNHESESQLVKVIRNGNCSSVLRNDIVVGDIVILDVGDEVPADGILLEAVSLHVNESTLTGELSARKTTNSADFVDDATYPSDHVMRGSTVIDGNGIMKVTMVGDKTEYGRVYRGAQIENNVKTPLSLQLDRLCVLITRMSYAIALLVVIGRGIHLYSMISGGTFDDNLIGIGTHVLQTLMLAVTIIVVAVPEGLPMSVSLSLALSMRRMLSTNNLVRKMHACETMGAATVICTDKTGTLTQNQMSVSDSFLYMLGDHQDMPYTEEAKYLIKVSIACNSTANLDFSGHDPKPLGNPTECALLLFLHAHKVNYRVVREENDIVSQVAFSTENKYMVTVIKGKNPDEEILLLKGAPEIVLGFCSSVEFSGGAKPLTKELTDDVNRRLGDYQSHAMRTLGFAYARIPAGMNMFDEKGRLFTEDMTFLGVVAISDPVRPETAQAVKECLSAGIKVKIVTGDTPGTAREVGRQIGLWSNDDSDANEITGVEFAQMSDEAAMARLNDIKIMSRARPMDKARLVRLLQQNGEVVAVTGDGTNDAPALKLAQVGLSMGDGTSVAKKASSITILDNSFQSINRAVLWGRSLYRNIRRFIIFQLIINVVACLIVAIGAFTGNQSPLTVTQMLWVNLIMDTFAAMALASLPPEKNVMRDKPRKTEDNIISLDMSYRLIIVGGIFVVILLALMHVFRCYDITSSQQLVSMFFNGQIDWSVSLAENVVTPYESALFFTIFVMIQFWNLFNAKAYLTNRSAFLNMHKCPSFLLILLVILGGQILIVNVGGELFNVKSISFADWKCVTLATSLVLIFGELSRLGFLVYDKLVKSRVVKD
ncbi:MAG: calcium-translocating P-type ATPase, PMCA-type [Bacteroidales bacterium]|nr:calcium-translocating P-type ATPase, PMCA-type [Bacteroidales bacterium]